MIRGIAEGLVDQLSSITAGSVHAAIAAGCKLLAAGNRTEAILWFDRALRLLPNEASVALLRASAMDGPDANAGLRELAALVDAHPTFHEAVTLYLAQALKLGQEPAAAAMLAGFLARQAIPRDGRFAELANRVAKRAQSPGWLALTIDGKWMLSLAQTARSIVLALDDEALPTAASGTRPAGLVRKGTLPRGWRTARSLTARIGATHLLGSPIDVQRFTRTEGFVGQDADGTVSGWAWHPADPASRAVLRLHVRDLATGSQSGLRLLVSDEVLPATVPGDIDQRRAFRVDPAEWPLLAEIRVTGPDGRDLAGSPLVLGREHHASRVAATAIAQAYRIGDADPLPDEPDVWRPLDAGLLGPGCARYRPARAVPRPRPLDVVIPVFRGAQDFVTCLASLTPQLPRGCRIVVVDDGSTDDDLLAAVAQAAARREVVVVRHDVNRGFPAAANTGLRHAQCHGPRDVLLLNPDTILPDDALRRLIRAAYADGQIGSVTPMTNNGTIVSYPLRDPPEAAPDPEALRVLDRRFKAANGAALVDIPSAVGFCMLIRHDCLAEVGVLRDDVFAQGYGEENDWCLRASHLGWRHVAATGIYVAHTGGTTFGPLKTHLIARNIRLLNRLHPGYDALIEAFQARDPIAPARRAVDLLAWRAGRVRGGSVVLVTHDLGGGVARHIGERCAAIRAEGRRPIIIRPGQDGACLISDTVDPDAPCLEFRLPAQRDDLVELLGQDHPLHLELHHFIGFGMEMTSLAELLGVPLDIYVHDYAFWCPRVTMVGEGDRYCGEPTRLQTCVTCVGRHGERLRDPIGVAVLRARSAGWLKAARHVIAPSRDAANRIARHFQGIRPMVVPWEDNAALSSAVPASQPHRGRRRGARLRILVPGAIGIDKGYELLLACACDAAERGLALEFIVVGFTMDDDRLLETGHVFITGKYAEDEAEALARQHHADLGFIPSVWPETWCYALSLLWRCGLRVAAFDLGAQAERIRQTGTGAVIPLGLPAPRVNDFLMGLGLN